MSLRFYIGASGSGKSTALYREIIERSMKHPEQNFFLIVPDQFSMQTQAELRQHIYNRHGVTAWIGAGNVFPDIKSFKWRQTLPSYGIGYRWEFKNRVNVRLDYGFGKGVSAFYFSINEAF